MLRRNYELGVLTARTDDSSDDDEVMNVSEGMISSSPEALSRCTGNTIETVRFRR